MVYVLLLWLTRRIDCRETSQVPGCSFYYTQTQRRFVHFDNFSLSRRLNGVMLTCHSVILSPMWRVTLMSNQSNQNKIHIAPYYVHADSEELGGWITWGRRVVIDKFLSVFWTTVNCLHQRRRPPDCSIELVQRRRTENIMPSAYLV